MWYSVASLKVKDISFAGWSQKLSQRITLPGDGIHRSCNFLQPSQDLKDGLEVG